MIGARNVMPMADVPDQNLAAEFSHAGMFPLRVTLELAMERLRDAEGKTFRGRRQSSVHRVEDLTFSCPWAFLA